MFLTEPAHIEERKKKRQFLEYYEKIMEGKLHISLQGLDTSANILEAMSEFREGSSLLFSDG